MSYETFADAYVAVLKLLLSSGRIVPPVQDSLSPGSRFGQQMRGTREILAHHFEVRDPRASLFCSSARPLPLPYCVGLLLWTAAGSDASDWIAYYNPSVRQFADDVGHFSGAFGHRIRIAGGVDQLAAIRMKLSADPSSRRTVALVAHAADNAATTREYPCAIALQYFSRDGALSAITYMRSQSAAIVLPYDAFVFMGLQCILADELGLDIGSYHHVSGSLHLYEDELATAEAVASAEVRPITLGRLRGGGTLNKLLETEARVRECVSARDAESIRAEAARLTHGEDFADTAEVILAAYGLSQLDCTAEAVTLLAKLSPDVRSLTTLAFQRNRT